MSGLNEIIIQIRLELGFEPFQVGDKVLCRPYYNDGILFEAKIHCVRSADYGPLYLLNCPIALGYYLSDLETKDVGFKGLDNTLYYRWVEEKTLELLEV